MKTHRPPVPTPAGGCAPAERHNQPEEAARQVSISPEVLQAAAEAVRISYPNSLQAELQQVGAKPQGFIAKHGVAARSALAAASTGPISAAALQETAEAALLAEPPPAISCVVLAGV